MRNNGSGRFNFFNFILLIILIILFHTEIIMLGVWLYTSIYPNPEGNKLLGTYYQIASKRNQENADKFYDLAVTQQTKNLSKASSAKEKAEMNLSLGKYYECGPGKSMDIEKAKSYYQEAKKEAAALNNEELNKKIEDTLNNANQGFKDPSNNPNCTSDNDYTFINSSFNLLNFSPNANSDLNSSKNGKDKSEANQNED